MTVDSAEHDLAFLTSRHKRLPDFSYQVKGSGHFALDVPFPADMEVDESRMSVWIPSIRKAFYKFADACRRYSMFISKTLYGAHSFLKNASNVGCLLVRKKGSMGFFPFVTCSVPFFVCFILHLCSPTKVGYFIVILIAIKMTAFHSFQFRPYKSIENKVVDIVFSLSRFIAKNDHKTLIRTTTKWFELSPAFTEPPTAIVAAPYGTIFTHMVARVSNMVEWFAGHWNHWKTLIHKNYSLITGPRYFMDSLFNGKGVADGI